MDRNFCRDKFLDLNQSWYNQVPEFSTCFEDLVLVSLPCLLYSLILFINLLVFPRLVIPNPLPWTWLNISKIILSFCLLIMSCIWCGTVIHDIYCSQYVPYSSLMSSCSKVAIFFLITLSMLKHRSDGVTTSITLSTFWLIFSLCCIILYRSVFLTYFILKTEDASGIIFILDMLFYPIIFIQLILSIFSDRRSFSALQEANIMDEISFLSYITFLWFMKFIHKGRKKLLVVEDFFFSSTYLTAKTVYASFEKHWKYYMLPEKHPDISLFWALFKAFWPWIVGVVLIDVFSVIMLLIPPLLLDRIIDFATDDFYSWRGFFFAFLIFFIDFVGKILSNTSVHLMSISGIQFQSALMGAIFRKNLTMANSARKDYNSGTLMSLLTVDVKRIQWFTMQFAALLIVPFKIALIIYVMWQYIGVSTLAGVAVIVVLFPFSYFVSRIGWKYNDKQMEVKDFRLKLMNEILNGIKILKLYAWEIPFAGRISKARNKEIKWIRYSFFTYLVTIFVYNCAPFMISIAAFATFLLKDGNNVLSPTKAFVTLTLMELLRYSLFELPDAVADLIQFNISLKRLRKYFNCKNKNEKVIGNNPDRGEAITVKGASFSWACDSDYVLRDINLHVPEGKLIAIIGPVGSGKSSLLSALLGELYKKNGSVDLKGTIAYVPQVTWVLNRSLKNNILLVKHMTEEKYNKILDFCCLRADLEILPAGDETEIGEKGVNLSGGQKLRVNLAQAVYQDKDIYLLDDPLSAVDVHVRRSLFNDVIGSNGLLKNKTRILVTHDTSILPDVDIIVSMKDGKIDEMGSYKELLNKKGSFASFVEEHSPHKTEESEVGNKILSISRLNSRDSTKSTDLSEHGGGDQLLINAEKCAVDEEENYRLTDNERMEIGGVRRLIYLNYVKQMGIPLFIGSAIGIMAYVSFQAGGNIWLSQWSSDVAKNGTRNSSQTIWRLSVYGSFGLAQVISSVLGGFLLILGVTRASERYHRLMLDSVMKSPMSFFDTTPVGRIINRFTTDMEILDNQLFYQIEGWLYCIFSAISSFVIIGMNVPIFLVFLLPLGFLYYFIMKLHLNTFRQIRRLESTGRSPICSLFMEAIQGVSSISAYGVKKDFIQTFEEKLDRCLVCTFNTYVCNRWLAFCLNTLGSSIVFITTILAIQNREALTPAVVGLIITYSLTVTDSLKWFVRTNSELENKSISIERIEEYCNLEPEAPWDLSHEKLANAWPQNGIICFEDYSTKYRKNLDLVLKEINFSIEASEKVGIIGRTGAGKSSITLALFRIIEPVSGTILIDDVDITKIGLHNLRTKLTIIPQDQVLFTGTLRINLDPNNEHSDDQLWDSLEKSYLKTFVSNLNEGLEYEIEEGGSNLSAGQRQLVCLARALLKNSKILVLDEATASVDMDTDNLIQNTIRTAFADRTVITIAHRINTVLDYDKIVVLENGNIIEVGNPSNLLENQNSRFYLMSKEAGLI
ncbi:Multidrug resistance-associated protein 1 like [Argiope bruennichi]|uniref:Multidrug resistance-associated protein 1 like n=1 Tax=Argiope bruennichi TaxID=94029 RepID=A0A8T0ESM0_ARGBR|nr:Multidrug resistance-associated protein 1 like [Argiope bruennichi]